MASDAVGGRCVPNLQFETTTLSWIAGPVPCSPLFCASNMVEEHLDAIALSLVVFRWLFTFWRARVQPFHLATCSNEMKFQSSNEDAVLFRVRN